MADPGRGFSLGRQSILGFKMPTVADPGRGFSLGRQSMNLDKRVERLLRKTAADPGRGFSLGRQF